MGRASIKEKKELLKRIRLSGMFFDSNNEDDPKVQLLRELEVSLSLYKRWKRRIKDIYEELYSQSKFLEKVRYKYKKLWEPNKTADEFIIVGWDDHQFYKRMMIANAIHRKAFGTQYFFSSHGYTLKYKGTEHFAFNPDKEHLCLLEKMARVNKMSQDIIKKIKGLEIEIRVTKNIK